MRRGHQLLGTCFVGGYFVCCSNVAADSGGQEHSDPEAGERQQATSNGAGDAGQSVTSVLGCAPRTITLDASSPTKRSVEIFGTLTSEAESARCSLADVKFADFYEVDVGGEENPVGLYATIEADFSPIITLEQGPCGDSISELCALAPRMGVNVNYWGDFVSTGHYVVAVGSEHELGDYHLQLWTQGLNDACEPSPNESCQTATPISLENGSNTIFLPAGCADSDEDSDVPNLYYSLDLSSETGPVALEIRVAPIDRRVDLAATFFEILSPNDEGPCGEVVVDDAYTVDADAVLSTILQPTQHLLNVTDRPASGGALMVNAIRADPGPLHDTCSTAEEISLVGGFASVSGSTHFHSDQVNSPCFEDGGADRIYRLDLSDREGWQRLRARIPPRGVNFWAGLALYRSVGHECGGPIYCYDSIDNWENNPSLDVLVEPDTYFLSIEGGEEGESGEYSLEVEVTEADVMPGASCIGRDERNCLLDNWAADACCENPTLPQCAAAHVSCGLDPDVQKCVCDSNPACCDGSLDDITACAKPFADCGYFCEEFPWNRTVCQPLAALGIDAKE